MLTPFAYKPLSFALKSAVRPGMVSPYTVLQYCNFRQTGKSTLVDDMVNNWLESLQKEAELKELYRPRMAIEHGEFKMRFPVMDTRPKIVLQSDKARPPFSHYDDVAFF